jgi:hypothetical protein
MGIYSTLSTQEHPGVQKRRNELPDAFECLQMRPEPTAIN